MNSIKVAQPVKADKSRYMKSYKGHGSMKRSTISKSQKKTLLETISKYLCQHQENIISAYVFGSFVNSESFSDIDIGVHTRDEIKKPLNTEIDLENQLEKLIHYRIDVRILNRAPISFSQNVIRSGILIVDRDPNLRADFEGIVLKKYFDFSRLRAQYLSEVINAPV